MCPIEPGNIYNLAIIAHNLNLAKCSSTHACRISRAKMANQRQASMTAMRYHLLMAFLPWHIKQKICRWYDVRLSERRTSARWK